MTVVNVQPVCHGESKEERDLLESMSGGEDGCDMEDGGEIEDSGEMDNGGEMEVEEVDEQQKMKEDCDQLLGRVLQGKIFGKGILGARMSD